MRLLADESLDFAVVRALRESGHDVLLVSEAAPGAPDSRVVELAESERRLLLTEDKDFGQLAFAAGRRSAGIVLVRFPATVRHSQPREVLRALERLGDLTRGCFVVVEPGKVRVNRPA